jgi:ABC-type glycerol-3-phosphate transport system permease component
MIQERGFATLSWRQSKQAQELIVQVVAYVILIIGSALFFTPFLWILSTSLKTSAQVFIFPPQWIPDPIMWGNYKEAMTVLPFHRYFINTSIVVVAATLGVIFSSSIVGYAFARLRAPGRDFLFVLLLSTMMLPQQVTMIPRYVIFQKLGMVNTLWPLIVPSWVGGAYDIFLMRQFLMTLHHELDDAAKIDGCGFFGIYWRILMPNSKPAILTIAILHLMWKYNDFMTPLIYLSSMDKYTVSLGLALFQGRFLVSWNLLMAATVVCIIPLILLFFVVQKYFIQGIVLTGIKG